MYSRRKNQKVKRSFDLLIKRTRVLITLQLIILFKSIIVCSNINVNIFFFLLSLLFLWSLIPKKVLHCFNYLIAKDEIKTNFSLILSLIQYYIQIKWSFQKFQLNGKKSIKICKIKKFSLYIINNIMMQGNLKNVQEKNRLCGKLFSLLNINPRLSF